MTLNDRELAQEKDKELHYSFHEHQAKNNYQAKNIINKRPRSQYGDADMEKLKLLHLNDPVQLQQNVISIDLCLMWCPLCFRGIWSLQCV